MGLQQHSAAAKVYDVGRLSLYSYRSSIHGTDVSYENITAVKYVFELFKYGCTIQTYCARSYMNMCTRRPCAVDRKTQANQC